MKENHNYTILLFPILNIYYILANAFNGFIFVFFRLPVIIYEMVAFRLDKTYRKFTSENGKPQINMAEAIKTKEKVKEYHYNAKTLDKMASLKAQLEKELNATDESRSKKQILYYYKAMNKEGKIVSGTMNGYAKQDINAFLLNEGYEVYTIKNDKWIDFLYGEQSISFLKPKLSIKDLLFWLTQLSTYLKAGITLVESIKILANQMGKTNKNTEKAFKAISYELTLGENFSDALAKQGSMFPPLLINMIKAAEATGTIIETLDDMANYYEEIDKTKKQMVSALTYPTIIFLFAIGVVTFIMVYVIPQFTGIYKDAGVELSGMTLFIINASNFIQAKWVNILLITSLIIATFIFLYKKILAFKTIVQSALMKMPIIGNVIIYNEIAIFTKTFSSLLKNNVFITDSMNILTKITTNEIYKDIMYNTINNIVKGEKISESFKNHWAIPDVAYYMIVTGESTGQLAEMMDKVSTYYQEMHKNIVNSIKSLIEPITIVFLAIIVGIIVIAVIVPMFSLYNELN